MAHTHAKPMEAMDLVFADRATVPCFIGSDCQAEIVSRLRQMKPKKFFVVLDESVNGLHGDFLESLRGSRGESGGETGGDEEVEVLTRVLPNGDACKSWDNLKCLIDWLFSSGAAKKDVIVGFGGGAVMNVTGLFASISYRGLRLARRGNTKHETTVYAEQEDEAKENNSGKSELEKRYQEIIVTIKKSRRQQRKRST